MIQDSCFRQRDESAGGETSNTFICPGKSTGPLGPQDRARLNNATRTSPAGMTGLAY